MRKGIRNRKSAEVGNNGQQHLQFYQGAKGLITPAIQPTVVIAVITEQ